jgi:hypothetical protein
LLGIAAGRQKLATISASDSKRISVQKQKKKEMNWEAIGAIGEVAGAIGVIVTLIYLAAQIRQSNDLSRSESRQALVANDVTSLTANLRIADVFAKLVSDDDLTAEDQLRLSFMFSLDLRNREFEYFQYTNGLLDEKAWLAYRQVILVNHSTRFGNIWWEEVGRGLVDPGFAKLVDDLLVDAQPDETYKKMATWANK